MWGIYAFCTSFKSECGRYYVNCLSAGFTSDPMHDEEEAEDTSAHRSLGGWYSF